MKKVVMTIVDIRTTKKGNTIGKFIFAEPLIDELAGIVDGKILKSGWAWTKSPKGLVKEISQEAFESIKFTEQTNANGKFNTF